MKKDKEQSLIRRAVNASFGSVGRIIDSSRVGRTVEELKNEFENAMELTKKKVAEVADHLSARILSFLLILMGLFFGFFGLGLFIVEETKISFGTSFMIIGLLVLLLGWISMRKK